MLIYAISALTTEATTYNLADINGISVAQGSSRSSVSAISFLMWDIFLTFDDEVKYIWSRNLTPICFMYVVTRYVPPLAIAAILWQHLHLPEMTPHQCRSWHIYQAIVSSIVTISMDILFVARVFALYHDRRVVKLVVLCLFMVEILSMIVSQAIGLPTYRYGPYCKALGSPRVLRGYSGATIGFQCILFLLTAYKFVDCIRSGWARIPLKILLVRDGTWAFLLVLSAQVTVFYIFQNSFRRLFYPWMWAFDATSGYRMFLNIRKFSDTELEKRAAEIELVYLRASSSPHLQSDSNP